MKVSVFEPGALGRGHGSRFGKRFLAGHSLEQVSHIGCRADEAIDDGEAFTGIMSLHRDLPLRCPNCWSLRRHRQL